MLYFHKRINISREKVVKNREKTSIHTSKYFQDFKNIFRIKKKGDLNRFVKWPLYVRIQKEKKILCSKIKVPVAIQQFSKPLTDEIGSKISSIFLKYKNSQLNSFFKKNNFFIKHGINNLTNLIQKKKALFVLIANDVNPIELVVWIPALCKRVGVSFAIIKNKSNLRKLSNKKSTSCVTIASENIQECKKSKIVDYFNMNFIQEYEK
ncbi:60S ribosomal protein L7A (nucleomorph) [Cryptomonas paramecium]|uniref:60S ribosomal protein L7a n=1 Tax=Cryptomonas paramaecium TaxID=2898 RepID=F2HIE4_9CRYP|nr:60S ribosomal protein L7A [Cryptomonas paramecium]AEA39068.1 60S ribosomal protein L7A [Cryptomonas paramecium]|mmetsp:Transcript_16867/g.46111  ORF Transcript_16867/g.46111 Transcript_16867/m.46111 type:complete len:208 (+) Transcript_16867:2504-3127(+)